MTYLESIKTCFNKYAEFSGRATRSEFWWFILFYTIVLIIAGCIKPGLQLLAMLIFFLPVLAANVRRLHDTNRSGWFLLLHLIPLIGLIIIIVWEVQEGTPGPNLYGSPSI